MTEIPDDEIEKILENGFAEMMRAFFRMRNAQDYQREYDSMGTIISCLMEDRAFLRKFYQVNP